MNNLAIAGWRVRNRIACADHVSHTADDYRSITIPIDAIGTLTGDIAVYAEGIDEQEWHVFAMDVERIKQVLSRDILPDQEAAIKKGLNYWQQTENLTGEDLLASRTALTVKWDGIYEQEPETLNCVSYIPWLELLETADMISVDN